MRGNKLQYVLFDKSVLGTTMPDHGRMGLSFLAAGVGVLVVGVAIANTLADWNKLTNGFWILALALTFGGALAITHRPGAPMYTLPVPVAALVSVVVAWDSPGAAILVGAGAVFFGTGVRGALRKDTYSTFVIPAMAALSVAFLWTAMWASANTFGDGSVNHPQYPAVFALLAAAYAPLDAAIGQWLRARSKVGRVEPVRLRTFTDHFAAVAATAIPAGVVTYITYNWDVATLVMPIMAATATVAIVTVRGLPGTASYRDRESTAQAVALADVLEQLGEAQDVGEVGDIVSAHYPDLFSCWEAHLDHGSQSMHVGDRGYIKYELAWDGKFLGTLTVVGPDPYAHRALASIAVEALARTLHILYEKEESIAAQRAAEARATNLAEQMDTEQKLFAAAQHEVGNPLAILDGYLGLLRMGVLDEDETKEAMEAMQVASKRIRLVSQSLLTLAASERSGVEPSLETVSCEQLVLPMRVEYGYMFEGGSISVTTPTPDALIDVDTLWIRQIVDNLVSNAVKATRTGGQVSVEVAVQGQDLVIKVEDSGCGIPKEDLDRANDAFWRAKTSNNRKVPGVGLGLYIVSGLVSLHNGEFMLESTEGKGTCATVRLLGAGKEALA